MSPASDESRAGTAQGNPVLDGEAFADEIASPTVPVAESWRPVLVRLSPGDLDRFAALCRNHRIALLDSIDRQLADLATVRLPSSDPSERQRFVEQEIAASGGREAYGSWIYLPWEAKVIHLLDRDDYFEVITSRDQEKITREEQHLLRTKRIGVMGLSVGGEAAVAVAQEHLCGSIVLADFDRLDLSNLNRLNAGCDELGLPKTTIAARCIARIDPYLEVVVFEDGVSDAYLDQFLDGLDLLIEECDGLRMKYEVRLRARERGINVVFAADERGFLSVEPYAYRPELPPFHGRIVGPPPPRESYPTPLAFMQALTEWMGGWDQISERSQRSLERIGDTLCGYPQLASEARYAAGQIGHVARRLLLGERLPPSLNHFDLTELVPSAPAAEG